MPNGIIYIKLISGKVVRKVQPHKVAKILLHRGAKVNHTNSNGNSALHFAFAYDTSGEIAQFLIENGADDSLVNVYGLSPYDGIGADELS